MFDKLGLTACQIVKHEVQPFFWTAVLWYFNALFYKMCTKRQNKAALIFTWCFMTLFGELSKKYLPPDLSIKRRSEKSTIHLKCLDIRVTWCGEAKPHWKGKVCKSTHVSDEMNSGRCDSLLTSFFCDFKVFFIFRCCLMSEYLLNTGLRHIAGQQYNEYNRYLKL